MVDAFQKTGFQNSAFQILAAEAFQRCAFAIEGFQTLACEIITETIRHGSGTGWIPVDRYVNRIRITDDDEEILLMLFCSL